MLGASAPPALRQRYEDDLQLLVVELAVELPDELLQVGLRRQGNTAPALLD